MDKNFVYRALDKSGEEVSATCTAEDRAAAIDLVRARGLYLISISEQADLPAWRKWLRGSGPSVGAETLGMLCRQFSTMLSSGIPILEAVAMLEDSSESRVLKKALNSIYRSISEGESLSAALTKERQVFPELMVNMVNAAETGGFVEKALDSMAAYFERKHDLEQKVKSAMMYPIILMCVTIVVGLIMLLFVLPMMGQLYSKMSVELPLVTKIVLGASSLVRGHIRGLMMLVLAGVLVLAHARQNVAVKRWINAQLLRLPVVGTLLQKVDIARFARTFAILSSSGIPVMGSLEVLKGLFQNEVYRQAIVQVQEEIMEGRDLASAFRNRKVFPKIMIQMMIIGESTGQVDQSMEKLAAYYERDVDEFTKRLEKLLEPIFLAMMMVVVGTLVFAFYLPMFKMLGSMGKMHH